MVEVKHADLMFASACLSYHAAPIPRFGIPFRHLWALINHRTIPEAGRAGFMSNAIRTTLSLVVSLVLFSTLTMAHAGGNNADKDKTAKHHSRLAKLAFWRHHKDADKNAKQARVRQASPRHQPKTAQIKPASAKQAASIGEQKQTQYANKSKPSAQKGPAANKTKPDPKTDSLKQ